MDILQIVFLHGYAQTERDKTITNYLGFFFNLFEPFFAVQM